MAEMIITAEKAISPLQCTWGCPPRWPDGPNLRKYPIFY